MPENYLKQTQAYIKKIIAAGESSVINAEPDIKTFIQQLYLHVPYDHLEQETPESLFSAAKSMWQFIAKRSGRVKCKVRVYNPDVTSDGWSSERTVVEFCLPDSPFILDSVTAELTARGLNIYEVMHPILHVSRDKKGTITAIANVSDSNDVPGMQPESTMHFQVSHIADSVARQDLENAVKNTLDFVSLTVSDWQTMTSRVEEVVANMDAGSTGIRSEECIQARDFLSWALENNFILLGYREYSFVKKGSCLTPEVVDGSDLGVFRSTLENLKPQGLEALNKQALESLQEGTLLEITKSNRKSIVHRRVPMDYIGIKKLDAKGNIIGEYRILGLFTSSVYYQSARLIPVIREKIDAIVLRSGFKSNSHNGKALVAVLEGYPRDELLQTSEDDLFRISMGIVSLNERPRTQLFVRQDRFMRFVSCIVFVPRERYNTLLREKIQGVLAESFEGAVSDYYTQVTESPLVRIHVLVKLDDNSTKKPNVEAIKDQLVEITSSWINGLRDALVEHMGEREGENLYRTYVDAFPDAFRSSYHFGGTYHDIRNIEEVYKDNKLIVDIYQLDNDPSESFQLKLYTLENDITLSNVLPILENMGFHAIDEKTFIIAPKEKVGPVWVHHFWLKLSRNGGGSDAGSQPALKDFRDEFCQAFYGIRNQEVEDDTLGKLIIRAGLKWRDVVLLRAYSKYILQIGFPYSDDFMADAVARHPMLTQKLVALFDARFNPAHAEDGREKSVSRIMTDIEKKLASVSNVSEDRVIRQFYETILATLRTNFYQSDSDGNVKSYISLKLDSKKVPNLPLPRPFKEIFVYSRDVEGIHLRGGAVARGGLRWSDRKEDFRTEVLGLVKAQMVKNSVIVPVGSKGGFVVKYPTADGRDAWLAQGQQCYQTYLSGLLDITDNLDRDKIIPPKHVVRHDGDDPYLVVAADKGTATFSDIANEVSADYNFWLDDAFASGGSVGYDHKKMGITARGGWVSVQRHFLEMGHDVQKQDFTVVGVGDMAGDVFGNGMLLSKHICLVGAFNHMHIFVDPNPDSATSFKERKRLFNLQRSTWMDYNAELISKGGGIFERSAKSIPVSKEMKECFDIETNSIAPDALIIKMLKAKVDLLWNGGIGTYVKAETESNESVGDKANDAVRVDGKMLRCRAVGEGGNLGLTQRARIEYALHGGRINTDAIDNSAGVDCSDHEVNIKIALSGAVERKTITMDERNTLLASMTDEVADLVLQDNLLQTLAISIAEGEGVKGLENDARLMRTLEEKGLLNREIEFLPDDEVIASRHASKTSLTRPELSVILSYAKLDIYDEILQSGVPDEPYFAKELVSYFPQAMRGPFAQEIEQHPLRREIIATVLANDIVNRMGNSFFHRVKAETGMKGCDIARGYMAARDAFNLPALWDMIAGMSGKVGEDVLIHMHQEVRTLAERATIWFINYCDHPIATAGLVKQFGPKIAELENVLESMLPTVVDGARKERLEQYVEWGVSKAIATRIARVEVLGAACDIVHVSLQSGWSVEKSGRIYYQLGTLLRLGWMRFMARRLISDSHWQNLAVSTISRALSRQQMKLALDAIQTSSKTKSAEEALNIWQERHDKVLEPYINFLVDLKKQETITLPMLTVALQRVEGLFRS